MSDSELGGVAEPTSLTSEEIAEIERAFQFDSDAKSHTIMRLIVEIRRLRARELVVPSPQPAEKFISQFGGYREMREAILHPRRGYSRSTWPFTMTLREQRETVLTLIDTLFLFEQQLNEISRPDSEKP